MRLRTSYLGLLAALALSCVDSGPTGVVEPEAQLSTAASVNLELWSNNLAINHNIGVPEPDGTVAVGTQWGFGIAATVVDHNDEDPGDGYLAGIVEGGEFVGTLTVLTPESPYPDHLTYEWQQYNEGREELQGKDYIQMYWGVGAQQADPPPPGEYTTIVFDRDGVEVGRHTILLTPEDIEALQPSPVILQPGPEAVLEDRTPAFTWAAYPVGPAAFIQQITVRGPAHLAPQDQVEYQIPFIHHDASPELSVTYPELATTPVPPELPDGRYTIQLHQNVSLGDDALRSEFYGAHSLHQSFVVGEEPSPWGIENAGINIASYPDGDESRGPNDHWFSMHIPIDGDFGATAPEDVHLVVDGNRLGVSDVTVHAPHPEDLTHEFVLEVHGDFGGGPAPLGRYAVAVADADGVMTEYYDLGPIEGYPTGMSRMTYPQPGGAIGEAQPTFEWAPGLLSYLGESIAPCEHTVGLHSPELGRNYSASLTAPESSLPYADPRWNPTQPPPLDQAYHAGVLISHYCVRPGLMFSRHQPFGFDRVPYIRSLHMNVLNFVLESSDGVPPSVRYAIEVHVNTVGDFSDFDETKIRFVAETGEELGVASVRFPPDAKSGVIFTTARGSDPPALGRYSLQLVDADGFTTPTVLSESLEDYPKGGPVLLDPAHGRKLLSAPEALHWTEFESMYLDRQVPSGGYELEFLNAAGNYHLWPADVPYVFLGDERWIPEPPAPLAAGTHFVSIRSQHQISDGIHFEHHWYGSFDILEDAAPTISSASLAIHSYPDGNGADDGAVGPDYHWWETRIELPSGSAPADVEAARLFVDGTPIQVDRLVHLPQADGRLVVEAWGEFDGGPSPFGTYSVLVVDDDGAESAPFVIGEVLDHPTGMSQPTYPYPGAVVVEAEPTFLWEAGQMTYLGTPYSPVGHVISLHYPEVTLFNSSDGSSGSVPFVNDAWTPYQPEPLGPGRWYMELTSVYQPLERISFIRQKPVEFWRPPPTLIINPQDHVTTSACPTYPDYIVQDESALRVAMQLVQPGEVIGIDGMVEIGAQDPWVGLYVDTDDLTLTCASPGSGLTLYEPVGWMVYVQNERVTIDHLTVDGRNSTYTIGAGNVGDGIERAAALRFTDNEIQCGSGICVFTYGVAGSSMEDNHFIAGPAAGVVWIQGHGSREPDGMSARPTDGTRFVDNTIHSTGDGGAAGRGVRIRDGSGVVITGNEFVGPINNPIFLSNLWSGVVERNRISGSNDFGLFMNAGLATDRVRSVLIKNNHFLDADVAAIYLDGACNNTFIGNNLRGSGDVILDTQTGGNAVNGVGQSVIDNGAFDCDGDGVDDPNIIAGGGTPRRGVQLGQMIRDAIQAAKTVLDGEIR